MVHFQHCADMPISPSYYEKAQKAISFLLGLKHS